MLFHRVVLSALLVGALSGLLLSVVQRWQVIPIIDAAERFEQARTPQAVEPARGEVQAHDHAGHDHGAHVHSATAWEPAEGAERIGFTVLSNVLTAAGFALIMLVAMAVALRRRDTATQRKAAARLDWRYGLLWGLAGYAVFFVAPAIGLPPEIPGAEAAPLESRQLWWMLTVACTAVGLTGAAFCKSPWRWTALALLVVPYLVGAPHLGASAFAEYPPAAAAEMTELAKRFVWATAITNGVFWIVLGALSGWAAQRFVRKAVA
jgi:cobalt transporter subunit CbtA